MQDAEENIIISCKYHQLVIGADFTWKPDEDAMLGDLWCHNVST